MSKNDCKDLRDELNELKTDFNDSQTAVLKTMKRVDMIYNDGGLSVEDYTSIIEDLRHAEI